MNNKKFLIFRIVLISLSLVFLVCIEYYQRKIIKEEQRKIIEEEKNKVTENTIIDASKLYITNNQDYYSELLKINGLEIRINTDELVKSNLINNNEEFEGYVKVVNDDFTFVPVQNKLIDRLDSKEFQSNSNNEKEAYDLKYIYKGENPKNYIKYNDKLYRIIGVTNSNDLKIISNESTIEENWGLSGEINYLKNNNSGITEEGYKGIFYVGYVRSETSDISLIMKNEKRNNTYTVVVPRYIGTYSYVNLSDIINASLDCKFNNVTGVKSDTCKSYLINMLTNTYTSIPLENDMVYKIDDKNNIISSKLQKKIAIKKVIYISGYNEFKSGNGTIENPYEIK
ncbi:MAG: hypothetical protein J6O56_02140 [Bacilli bacterium]|nr:hypothetical protein [Bacilli bacterium]